MSFGCATAPWASTDAIVDGIEPKPVCNVAPSGMNRCACAAMRADCNSSA